MHEEWSKARVIAALAALDDAGLGRRKLSEIAGVDHSTIGRWARGRVKPDYSRVRRLALGVWHSHPQLARELVEASGYPWADPTEAEAPPPTPLEELFGADGAEDVRRKIRIHKGADADWYISAIESALSAPPAGECDPQSPDAGRARRQG